MCAGLLFNVVAVWLGLFVLRFVTLGFDGLGFEVQGVHGFDIRCY